MTNSSTSREISILQNRGVNVITATSTREALGKLAGAEAVVTDSARQEYGQFNSRAGLDLIRLVDELRPGLPVFIYTLASTAQRIRPEATDLGAAGVFGSSVDIIAALGPPPAKGGTTSLGYARPVTRIEAAALG